MAFNIQDMKAQLTFGGARPSLFQVQITNPINTDGDFKTPFMVKATSIPASTLGIIEVPYFGRKLKVAGNRTFEDWNVTVINDEDFIIRNALENWSSQINTHIGNLSAVGSTPANYKSQGQVTQFAKDGSILREYTVNGIFPTAIAEIPLDWDTTDTIEEFEVTFAYDWWQVSGGKTGNSDTNV